MKERSREPRFAELARLGLEWLAFMRHAEVDRRSTDPCAGTEERLTDEGRSGVVAVGRRLHDEIGADALKGRGLLVFHAGTDAARETAEALALSVDRATVATVEDLDGPEPPDTPIDEAWRDVEQIVLRLLSQIEKHRPKAVVLVGHDPRITRLLNHVVESAGARQRFAGALPLDRGELAMLRLQEKAGVPKLVWTLTPSDGASIDKLQTKIKSKMDTSKVLGAFLTGVLLFAVKEFGDPDREGWAVTTGYSGVLLLGLGTVGYFVCLFLYDKLLMPVRFWSGERPSRSGHARRRSGTLLRRGPTKGFVERPPSGAPWILYQNMIRVWTHVFIPATGLGGIGTLLVAVALIEPDSWQQVLALSGGVVALVAGYLWFWRLGDPPIGVSD